MQRAVAAEKRLSDAQNRCWYCFNGAGIRKHLIIALGDHAMLMLPPQGAKMEGHCLIVPQDVRVLPYCAAVDWSGRLVWSDSPVGGWCGAHHLCVFVRRGTTACAIADSGQ